MKLEDVIDLFEQGMTPSLELSREESIERGWMHHDTERTRLIQLKGELIEIDYRMRPSKCGRKVVWCAGQHPGTRKGLKKAQEVNALKPSRVGRKDGSKKDLKSILKKFLDTPIGKREYDKLPAKVRSALGDYMGGELTRADVAAFALMGKAMSGDINAFKEIADRVEGKPVQRTENKNMNMNYTDFLGGLAGFSDDEDDDEDLEPIIEL